MKNAWLLRNINKSQNSFDILCEPADNIVKFTCVNMNMKEFENQNRDDIKQIISGNYQLDGIKLGNLYTAVDNFQNQIRIGDYILIAGSEEILFGIVQSPCRYNEQNNYLYREMNELKKIIRKKIPSSLTPAFRVGKVIADVSNYSDAIANIIDKDNISQDGEITIEFPIRTVPKVLSAKITIPKDLTREEAKRISKYFENTYFFD